MDTILLDKILDIAPWALGYLVVIIASVIVTRFYYTRFKKIEDKIEHANCKTHKHEINECQCSITNVRSDVRNIEKILLKKDKDLISELSITRSPRQLSDKGVALLKTSGAEKLMNENIDFFIMQLRERKPSTELDVEECAFSVLLSNSDNDIYKEVKRYVYNNPKYNEEDLTLTVICFISSIVLRNEYLRRYEDEFGA